MPQPDAVAPQPEPTSPPSTTAADMSAPASAKAPERQTPAERPMSSPATTPSRKPRSAAVAVESPSAAASPGAASKAALNFQKILFEHIEHYRHYPEEARREGLQGVVQLLFAMRRDGTVLDVWVKASSGSAILDRAAIDTIRRAQPLPLIPSALSDRLDVVIPIAFSLP
jgi:protein TonB